jgi:hypothetical protein
MRLSLRVLLAAIAINLVAGILAAPARAGTQENCDKKLASQWPNQPEPKDWGGLYRLFKQFGVCDEGAIGERFSRDVAQLFSKQWTRLDALDRLAAADKAFERFVLRHIDKSLDEDELLAIADNSKSHCPTGENRICSLVHARAQDSLDAQRDASE